MGVLKARVSGSWVDLTVGGSSPFPGGVAGDLLVKQSATLNDAIWDSKIPKLELTSITDVALDNNNPALSIGSLVGNNLAFSKSYIQSRSNGAINTLHLNPHGGQVQIGASNQVSNYVALNLITSGLSTNERVAMYIGDWLFGQDYSQNNVKDFFIYKTVPVIYMNEGQNIVTLANNRWAFGAHPSHNSYPSIWLGGVTPGTAYTILKYGNDTYINNDNSGNLELRINNATYLRCNAGSSVNIIGRGFGTELNYGITCGGTLTFSQANPTLSASSYLQVPGGIYISGGISYHEVQIMARTGIRNDSNNGVLRLNGTTSMVGNMLCFYSTDTDTNHRINYSNETPPGSGETVNGVRITCYSGFWVYGIAAGANFFMSQIGNTFINSGRAYTTFSSIKYKENIVYLDTEECLEQVKQWRPCEFDIKRNPDFPDADIVHSEGFIAEEHILHTPSMVSQCGEDGDLSIGYGHGIVRLSGAVQALLKRVEELEKKVA